MSDVWYLSYFEVIQRILIAGGLAGIIGWEREKNMHPAGLRTHILVCVGATLVMLISIYGFAPFMTEPIVRFDPSRISAQVISGIGFLGAGTIIRQGPTVSGLTTAASLWVVAAIGLAVGAGYEFAAIFSTVVVFVCLNLMNRWEEKLIRKEKLHIIYIYFSELPNELGPISDLLNRFTLKTRNVQLEKRNESHILKIEVQGEEVPLKLFEELYQMDVVERVKQS